MASGRVRRRKGSTEEGGRGVNVHLIRIRHMAYGAERVTGPAMIHLRGKGEAALRHHDIIGG